MLPTFDGARLDDIVDYLTFVFAAGAAALSGRQRCPTDGAGAVASVVLLSSAYGFASADAKTDDHFFTGFPSYWNIVALYLYVAAPAAGGERGDPPGAERAGVRAHRLRLSVAHADAARR